MNEPSISPVQYSIQKLSSGEQHYKNYKNISNESLEDQLNRKNISEIVSESKTETVQHGYLIFKPLETRNPYFMDLVEKGENRFVDVKKRPFALFTDEYDENLDAVDNRNAVRSKTKYIAGIDDEDTNFGICGCCF